MFFLFSFISLVILVLVFLDFSFTTIGAANFFSVDSRTPPKWSDSSFSCAQKHTVQRLPKCAGFMCAESARILITVTVLFTEYGGEGEYFTNFGSFEPR